VRVARVMATSMNCPGHNASSSLAKRALRRTVPVCLSTVLSKKVRVPGPVRCVAADQGVDRNRAGRGALADARNSRSGTAKATSTGRIWLTMASGVSLRFTTLPAWARMRPMRPSMGERIEQYCKSSRAFSTAASSPFTAAPQRGGAGDGLVVFVARHEPLVDERGAPLSSTSAFSRSAVLRAS